MDPRHKLYKSLDKLSVDSPTNASMSARTDEEAAQVQASSGVTSGVTMDLIKRKLEDGLGATYVEIEDMSGMYRIMQESYSLPSPFRAYFCKRGVRAE
jgi:hypothetical protein